MRDKHTDANLFRRLDHLYPPLPKGPTNSFARTRLTSANIPFVSEKGRRPNLSKAFVAEMEAKLGLRFETEGSAFEKSPPDASGGDLEGGFFGPEDVFYYAYAVFHSPTYRERYAEFLKIDFPRLPLDFGC